MDPNILCMPKIYKARAILAPPWLRKSLHKLLRKPHLTFPFPLGNGLNISSIAQVKAT